MKKLVLYVILGILSVGVLQAEGSTYTGTVSWFDKKAGYGFIESNKEKIFVHFSAIDTHGKEAKNLMAGQRVVFQFKIMEGKKRATWVRVVS